MCRRSVTGRPARVLLCALTAWSLASRVVPASAQTAPEPVEKASRTRLDAVIGPSLVSGDVHGAVINPGLEGVSIGLGAEWNLSRFLAVGGALDGGLAAGYGTARFASPTAVEPFVRAGFGHYVAPPRFGYWAVENDPQTLTFWSPGNAVVLGSGIGAAIGAVIDRMHR